MEPKSRKRRLQLNEGDELDGYHEVEDNSVPDNVNNGTELTASQAAAVMALSDIFEEGEPEDEYYDYYKPDRIRELTRGDIETVTAHAKDCMTLIQTRQLGDTELKNRIFIYEDLLVMIASETAVRVEIICLKAGLMTPREMRDLLRRKAQEKMKEKK
jgi:hypothetical protein